MVLDRPLAAGIVNVTTDSMFSGARSGSPDAAIADGLRLAEAGFDFIDVGAIAARSGPPVPAAEEAARLVPAIAGIVAETGLPVMADTFSAEVARAALEAGAGVINDISGGTDPEMFGLVAETGCGYVLMHMEGPPRVDRDPPDYRGREGAADVIEYMAGWFVRRLLAMRAAGVRDEQVVLDPGPDFDLSVDDDLEILRRMDELRVAGRPLFMAISRKDFIGAVAAGSWDGRLDADERGPGTIAATALAVAGGAEILRLHDVAALDALRITAAITGPTGLGGA